jgi:hypothetical protein
LPASKVRALEALPVDLREAIERCAHLLGSRATVGRLAGGVLEENDRAPVCRIA